jgi:hypothetical protein
VVFWGKEGVNGGKLPFYYVGRPAIDADTVYDQYFRSGVTKRIEYKNSEFDRLIDEEQKTGDPKKRPSLHVGRNLRRGAQCDLEGAARRKDLVHRDEDSDLTACCRSRETEGAAQRAPARNQRSEVRGQKSVIGGQLKESALGSQHPELNT